MYNLYLGISFIETKNSFQGPLGDCLVQLPCPKLDQLGEATGSCVELGFTCLLGWSLHSIPGKPVFNHPHRKKNGEMFHIQTELFVLQFVLCFSRL